MNSCGESGECSNRSSKPRVLNCIWHWSEDPTRIRANRDAGVRLVAGDGDRSKLRPEIQGKLRRVVVLPDVARASETFRWRSTRGRAVGAGRKLTCRLGTVCRLSRSLLLYPPEWVREHDREVSEAEARSVAGASSSDIMNSRIEALLRFDGRALAPRIRCPTLVIAALDDRVTPAYFSRALAQAIPGARLVLLDGGGHFLPIVEAERYAEIVLRFLSEPGGKYAAC